ncbi:MAG: ABC transporter substrate-binding protein [Euzebyaceae bacterium]|nr:ABC transporter substrate-binding protein [Euzebyaceae bacterium]
MERNWKFGTLVAVLALALAACGGGGDQADEGGDGGETVGGETAGGETAGGETAGGETAASGEPIVIGALFDLSGATSDIGVPYAEGIQAYAEWRNANGGIEGRQIELNGNDYAYEVPQAEQLYSQYVSEGAVAIQGWGTGDTEALRTKIAQDEIPFMSASYSEELASPEEAPYNFVIATTYSDQLRIALKYIAEQAGGERVEVAVFHHDSPFGESPLEDGRTYVEEEGLDIGYETYAMPSGATDYVGQLSQAQQQGAEYIVVQNVTSPGAQLARDIAGQGLDVQLFCLNWCGDEIFTDLAGDAAEGTLGILPWAPPQQAEGLDDVTSYLESQGQTLTDVGLHFTQAWFTMAAMAQGIENVITAGEEVTGPAIKEALEEMGSFETPVSVPIEFSAESHAGMDGARVYQVEDGTWTPITDNLTP